MEYGIQLKESGITVGIRSPSSADKKFGIQTIQYLEYYFLFFFLALCCCGGGLFVCLFVCFFECLIVFQEQGISINDIAPSSSSMFMKNGS